MDDKTFEFMEKLYNRIEEGFKEVSVRMDGVEERLTGKIAQFEHNHGQKLDALFDGYTANTEGVEELRIGLTANTESINSLRSEMKTLETKVETHEVQLKIVK